MLPPRLVVIALVVLAVAPLWAVDSDKAQYLGGTIEGLVSKADGEFITSGSEKLVFRPRMKILPTVEVPYAAVTGLEYGQKAGRRVAVGILVTPWALFSKKRNHYLTISFNDQAGKEQAMVLELGKDIIRVSLTVLETRTGKAIEYQDEEARKAGRG